MIFALVLLPLLGAAGAYAHREAAFRTVWLVVIATLHTILVAISWLSRPGPLLNDWLTIDALGLLVLTIVSITFFVTAIYTVGYLRREDPRGGRAFVSCLLAFLGSASLVATSHHIGLLWVGMEATTLAVVPLIFHHQDRRSLEAVWKYLLICSVGIALALLGTFFLAAAQSSIPDPGRSLVLPDLVAQATRLDSGWLKAAFIFLLVGFGTKMGIAPMHTWKPDTYGEAPSLVSGLMAAALTACAFLGVARATQVVTAAGLTAFARPLLIGFGLASLVVAAAFAIGQADLRRLLAYSSVEHVGLLVLGLGLGGVGTYGSVLHVVNQGVAKCLTFLAAGNLVLAFGTSAVSGIRGAGRSVPMSGALLLIGLFALSGSPPFGPFVSEFTILRAAVSGYPWVAAATIVLLGIVFVGMAGTVLDIVYGGEAVPKPRSSPESPWLITGPAALSALALLLGVYLPSALRRVLAEAATALGGIAP